MADHLHFDAAELAARWRRDRAEINRRAMEGARGEANRAMVALSCEFDEAELAFTLALVEAKNRGAPTPHVGMIMVSAISGIVTTFANNFPGDSDENARVLLQLIGRDVATILAGEAPETAVMAKTALRATPGGRA